MSSNYFLYGPPGSGKSTLGRGLADHLGLPFWDLDHEIEISTQRKIAQIFQENGESGFRTIERKVLEGLLSEEEKVISLGGGTLLNRDVRTLVESRGQVLVLNASTETINARLKGDSIERPLLRGDLEDKLKALVETRREHYQSFQLQISNDGLTSETAIEQAQIALGAFRVKSMGQPYDVKVIDQGLSHIGRLLRQRDLAGPVAVITDQTVADLYAVKVVSSLLDRGYQTTLIVLPTGEAYKTLQSVSKIWDGLLSGKLERSSTLLALGGGVINDLAGFAAATYLRGISWVTVPTTLLAMVDASLGGKTGADLPQGKNLVGAFHPPRLVVADTSVLQTLPSVEFNSGMAEVIKHGIISDPELFQLCAQNCIGQRLELWNQLVRRAMAVKIKVIEADPYEDGWRAALNLGHTIGHAIESASNYSLRHGEAVAIGIVMACRIGERLGITLDGVIAEVERAFRKQNLPINIPESVSLPDIWQKMYYDKKRQGGGLRFVLPVKIGDVKIGIAVDKKVLEQEGICVKS